MIHEGNDSSGPRTRFFGPWIFIDNNVTQIGTRLKCLPLIKAGVVPPVNLIRDPVGTFQTRTVSHTSPVLPARQLFRPPFRFTAVSGGHGVGVAVGKDGSLFVTEDGNGTIWRVSHSHLQSAR